MHDFSDEPPTDPDDLLASGPVLRLHVDAEGRILEINATVSHLLGRDPATLIGGLLPELGAPTPNGRPALERTIITPLPHPAQHVVELQREDGTAMVALYAVHPRPEGGAIHWAIEMTAASMEQQLRVARQAAQRELVANLSHNLNNILTGVLAPAQLLLETVHDPDAQQDLRDILDATTRARTLLREMYRAVRIEPESVAPVDVAPMLSKIRRQYERSLVRVRTIVDGSARVMATESGLQTILEQLVRNAVESNPASEVVEVELRAMEGWAHLTIRDDGRGMDHDARRRLFEPLFTTKPGVGVGMSLAAARPRLQQWGGDIFVQSTLHQGTTVTLRLRSVTDEPRPNARGRVLIVEDEPHIARALRRLFSRNHEVVLAHDGPDVLERLSPTDFDVAVIDLSMPEMSGDELARALREQDPTLTLILLTGWLIQPNDPLMEDFDGLMQKPITDLTVARQKIQEAIDGTRRRRAELMS